MPIAVESFLQSFEDRLTREARFEQVDRKRDGRHLGIHGFLPVLVHAAKQVGTRVVVAGYLPARARSQDNESEGEPAGA